MRRAVCDGYNERPVARPWIVSQAEKEAHKTRNKTRLQRYTRARAVWEREKEEEALDLSADGAEAVKSFIQGVYKNQEVAKWLDNDKRRVAQALLQQQFAVITAYASGSGPRGIRFSREVLSLAVKLSLNLKPSLYEELRTVLSNAIPTLRTCKEYYAVSDLFFSLLSLLPAIAHPFRLSPTPPQFPAGTSNYDATRLKALAQRIDGDAELRKWRASADGLPVVLALDACSVSRDIVVSRSGKLIGLPEKQNLASLAKDLDDTSWFKKENLISYVSVAMIDTLVGENRLRYPVAVYPSGPLKSHDVKEQVDDGLFNLARINVRAEIVCFDGASENRTVMNVCTNVSVSIFLSGKSARRGGLHRWETERGIGGFTPAMSHPVYDEHYVFFQSDTPHGCKKWRGSLFSSGPSLATLAKDKKSRAMKLTEGGKEYHLYHKQLVDNYLLDCKELSGLSSSKVSTFILSPPLHLLLTNPAQSCSGLVLRPGDGQLGRYERCAGASRHEQAFRRDAALARRERARGNLPVPRDV